jgi:predicted dehydrogenase
LCTKQADAASLICLAESKQLALITGHTFLFNAGLRELKRQLDAGQFGTLRYLSARRTNLGPVRTDVNAAFDLAAHDVAIFNWLLGTEPQEVSATGGAFLQAEVHDVVFISLRYPGNRIGHIHAGWLEPRKVRQLTLVGTERMAIWDDLQPSEPVTVFDSTVSIERGSESGEQVKAAMRNGLAHVPTIEFSEPLKVQSQCFLDAIRSGNWDPSHGRFAVGVVRTLEMVDRSLRRAGAPQAADRFAPFAPMASSMSSAAI